MLIFFEQELLIYSIFIDKKTGWCVLVTVFLILAKKNKNKKKQEFWSGEVNQSVNWREKYM